MMLNPFDLILILLARLLGMAAPRYRPPIQPPRRPANVIELRQNPERGHDRGMTAADRR